MIKPDILVANDDSAGNTGAQSTCNSYNAVIKKADETTEETFVEEEPQESPTPSLVTKPAISVAYDNSVNCSVQSAGIFCDTAINGDMSSTDSRDDYNLEKAETAASVKEFEQQAEAAATAMHRASRWRSWRRRLRRQKGRLASPKVDVAYEVEGAYPEGGAADEA